MSTNETLVLHINHLLIDPHILLRKYFLERTEVDQLSRPEETTPGIITTGK